MLSCNDLVRGTRTRRFIYLHSQGHMEDVLGLINTQNIWSFSLWSWHHFSIVFLTRRTLSMLNPLNEDYNSCTKPLSFKLIFPINATPFPGRVIRSWGTVAQLGSRECRCCCGKTTNKTLVFWSKYRSQMLKPSLMRRVRCLSFHHMCWAMNPGEKKTPLLLPYMIER